MTTATPDEVSSEPIAVATIDTSTLSDSKHPDTDLMCHLAALKLHGLLALANGSWNPVLAEKISPARDAVRDACVDAFMRDGKSRPQALDAYADLSTIGTFNLGSMMAKATLACKAPKSR